MIFHEFGIPINQEDMAATLLAFSVNALSGIELIIGKPLSEKEQLDYIALWRYIGWLLGVHTRDERREPSRSRSRSSSKSRSTHESVVALPPLDPCGGGFTTESKNPLIHSRAMLESIIFHLMHPNELSSLISKHLLRLGNKNAQSGSSSSDQTTQSKSQSTTSTSQDDDQSIVSFAYLYRSYMCRRSIGDDLADALRLPRPSYTMPLKHIAAYNFTTIVLLFLRIYTLLIIHNSWFAKKAYKWHQRIISNFFTSWKRKNDKRMETLSRASFKNSTKAKHLNETQKSYHCPFSLVMPPLQNDDLGTRFKKDE